jgi:cytochrome c oxidase subunit I+III
MTEVLDVSSLRPYSISNRSLLFWGQALLCAIEGTVLLILIVIYFYLRLSVDVWPPPGTPLPSLTLPSLAFIPLVLSAFGSYYASESAKRNHRDGMITGLAINLALAIVFLLMREVEWRGFTFRWFTDAHGTIVWTILFLHTLDVIADLLMTAVLILFLLMGRAGERQRVGVHVDSVIWYFLVAIWVPLYLVVYWGPRVLGNHS